MPTLSIIQGFIAAGKTTFAEKSAAETGAVVLNADRWVTEHYTEKDYSADWDKCYSDAVDALWRVAEEKIRAGQDVIMDLGFWSRASRVHARQKAKEWGCAFCHYYLDTPDSLIHTRLRTRTGPIAEKNLKDYAQIRGSFSPPGDDEEHVIIRT